MPDGGKENGETVDILCRDRLTITQKRDGYRFSIDAILLAQFVHLKKGEAALDVGTGCGIIPIYKRLQGYTNRIVGVEIQKDLYGLAVKNRELNGYPDLDFRNFDVRRSFRKLSDILFNVVFSNPPFTRKGTGRKSPSSSRDMARYESTLDLPGLLRIVSRLLPKKGRFYLIYPVRRLAELIVLAGRKRLELKRIRFIHPRPGEAPNLFLAEFLKEGGSGVKVEKPLYIFGNSGYTEEVASYYSL